VIYQYCPYPASASEDKCQIPINNLQDMGAPLPFPLPRASHYIPDGALVEKGLAQFKSLATPINKEGVLPYSLCIGSRGGGVAPLLEVGSPLPAARTRCFQVLAPPKGSLERNHMDDVSLPLFLGDAVMARENILIGSIDFPFAVLPADGLILVAADVDAVTNNLTIVVSTASTSFSTSNSLAENPVIPAPKDDKPGWRNLKSKSKFRAFWSPEGVGE